MNITSSLLLPTLYFVLINQAIVVFGYMVVKKSLVLMSWFTLTASVVVVNIIFLHMHPILRMLAIIATTFTAMKVIAVTDSYKGKPLTLKFNQWFMFATGWAGMRAQPFETLGGTALPDAWSMIRFGTSRIIGGLLLILLAHGLVKVHFNHTFIYILTSVILLIGFSLVLHFGILSISAGMWRLSGANTYLLFKKPAKATSLTEFWSKRWNIAFSEMTAIAIFRPLRHKLGGAAALMVSFIFSGLLHELALSVPVNNGYGLPTLYFVVHGNAVLMEQALRSKGIKFLENKVVARLWVFFWIVVPIPLLFHTRFIREIVWPLAGLNARF